jgi:hypothetical protein
MKKLLGILVLGLLWCNVGFPDILPLDFKIERQLYNYPCFNELPIKKYKKRPTYDNKSVSECVSEENGEILH